MTWAEEAVVTTVSNHSMTNGGRIIAALAASSGERVTLAQLLVAAISARKLAGAAEFLANASGDPGRPPWDDHEEAAPSLDPKRPTFVRPNGETYYARPWGKFWDVEVLKKGRDTGKSVLLLGPPGTGKTAMAEAAFGEEMITVVITGETRVGELVGTFVPDGKGYRWVRGPLQVAVEEGLPILVDEILLGDPTVLSLFYPLMDGRGFLDVSENPEIGVVKAKEGFYIIGAGNPDVPGAKLSEALGSRFPIHVEVTTDWELAKILGVDPNVVDAISTLAASASGTNPSLSWAPQFRELLAFKALEDEFGREFAFRNLMRLFPRGDVEEAQERLGNIVQSNMLRPAKI